MTHFGEEVWRFETAQFRVVLFCEQDDGYQYDGDDEDDEIQRKLDNGICIAFTSTAAVYFNDECIGSDSLCGSVYDRSTMEEFWTAHRRSDAMNRNCSIMRDARGSNCCIVHYFPDMVQQAIKKARDHVRGLRDLPYIRESAK